jgi:hypothetical protein
MTILTAYAVSHYLSLGFLVATVICLGGVLANEKDAENAGFWGMLALVCLFGTIVFGGIG